MDHETRRHRHDRNLWSLYGNGQFISYRWYKLKISSTALGKKKEFLKDGKQLLMMDFGLTICENLKACYISVVCAEFTSCPVFLQNGFCHVNASLLTASIQSYTNVTSGDADALKLALYKNGPAAVSIDASHRSFVFYSHGVYYEPACGTFTSHWCSYFSHDRPSLTLLLTYNTSCAFQVIPQMIWTTLCLQWDMAL